MIKHIKCDIFESGADIICHQVNCQGAMNSGIAKQVRDKYPEVYESYSWYCKQSNELLGKAYPTYIHPRHNTKTKIICNLFAQENYGYDGKCYTNYDALKSCLMEVASYPGYKTIAIPYLMSCHRGGGDWNVVYKMIEEVFADSDCDVLICEYNGG